MDSDCIVVQFFLYLCVFRGTIKLNHHATFQEMIQLFIWYLYMHLAELFFFEIHSKYLFREAVQKSFFGL